MSYIRKIFRGILIGIANAIPGVSGGTMMVSMGIYDEIIHCITHLLKQMKKSIITLLPYAIGMAAGIVGLSYGIKYLLSYMPFQTSMAFIGLILGGFPMLIGKVKKTKIQLSHAALFLVFFALIIVLQMVGGTGTEVQTELVATPIEAVKLFFVGIVAAATMVIPGVSGSMILMILGYYYPIINTITVVISSLLDGNINAVIGAMCILVPFGIGVVAGIFVIAKLIEWLFENFETHTYYAIIGLVAASPVAIFMSNPIGGVTVVAIITGLICFACGFVIAYHLGRE